MTQAAIATTRIFQTRDLFVHDGSHLRRLRLSAPVQMAMLVAMVLLLRWSAYSAFRLIARFPLLPNAAAPAAVSSDIARLAAATEATRPARSKQRQAGPRRDDRRPEGRSGSDRQARLSPIRSGRNCGQGGPFDSATQADPTFKSLFTSWKKLDNLADGAIAVPSDKPVRTAAFTSGYGIRSDPFRAAPPAIRASTWPRPVGTADLRHRRRHRQRSRLQQRRLRQSHQGRPWPRHRDPLRPPLGDPRPARPARHSRPA